MAFISHNESYFVANIVMLARRVWIEYTKCCNTMMQEEVFHYDDRHDGRKLLSWKKFFDISSMRLTIPSKLSGDMLGSLLAGDMAKGVIPWELHVRRRLFWIGFNGTFPRLEAKARFPGYGHSIERGLLICTECRCSYSRRNGNTRQTGRGCIIAKFVQ